jgi:hypothetical protein
MTMLLEKEAQRDIQLLRQAWENKSTFALLPEKTGVDHEWIEKGLSLLPDELKNGHFVLLTSGTTGAPKLVIGQRQRSEKLAATVRRMWLARCRVWPRPHISQPGGAASKVVVSRIVLVFVIPNRAKRGRTTRTGTRPKRMRKLQKFSCKLVHRKRGRAGFLCNNNKCETKPRLCGLNGIHFLEQWDDRAVFFQG